MAKKKGFVSRNHYLQVILLCASITTSLAIGSWLVLSSIGKLVDPSHATAIAEHGVVPLSLVPAFTMTISILELVIGVSLIGSLAASPTSNGVTLFLCSVLLLVFALYALWLCFNPPPRPTSCGCGMWANDPAVWPVIATRNGTLATLCCLLATWKRPMDGDSGTAGGTTCPQRATGCCWLCSGCLCGASQDSDSQIHRLRAGSLKASGLWHTSCATCPLSTTRVQEGECSGSGMSKRRKSIAPGPNFMPTMERCKNLRTA